MPAAARRPTLTAVAERAGVSIATASKVVNRHSDVAPATRARVESAVAELGYRTPGARNAETRRIVEFMVDKLGSPYAMEVLRGVTLAAEEADVDVTVSRVRRGGGDRPEPPSSWTRRLISARRTGAIVVTAQVTETTYDSIARARLPVVVIDPLHLTTPELVSVGSTNWSGGRTATEHLLALGHTRIAMIGGPEASMSALARADGFRSACQRADVAVDPALVRHVAFDHDAAQRAADAILRLDEPPTAILASSDEQALGVLEAARRLGVVVPRDLSVVGYDDTYVAAWTNPPLTAVRQPLQDIGRVALRTVLAMDEGRQPDSHHIELATTLVVRDSTAPPRA
ncbi:LacI family DNA-binding transcriptional regulator [Cellulomonas wangsupingiae]|uniref:Substrate-binding domain-containing protein n=1 Tax=Cellulomonas wangsupingiae TaxID=2968085 RepID=A0ABY5K5S3_9CELL|nr:substrate-binding domain-containing protein [Cellulomonas wangsupingiae]MCC2334078.1 substrate-binding domain-containing protein [Cellulomonas wangsupingiae]MCM0641043.1 substrate-binding domain-containing protein [Cellulomonas wangsupingiae]UUI65325.1 substrate-binding domain-containing protein [Cellulomonas wangsupingiae]